MLELMTSVPSVKHTFVTCWLIRRLGCGGGATDSPQRYTSLPGEFDWLLQLTTGLNDLGGMIVQV